MNSSRPSGEKVGRLTSLTVLEMRQLSSVYIILTMNAAHILLEMLQVFWRREERGEHVEIV